MKKDDHECGSSYYLKLGSNLMHVFAIKVPQTVEDL